MILSKNIPYMESSHHDYSLSSSSMMDLVMHPHGLCQLQLQSNISFIHKHSIIFEEETIFV